MNTEDPPDADYEKRLQRRLGLLRKAFEEDKIRINSGLQVIESLKAVRYASDGTVDLNTVDPLVRSLALAMEAMHDREEAKKAWPIEKIQSTYFTFLNNNFGEFFRTAQSSGMNAHDVGLAFASNPSLQQQIVPKIPEFMEIIEEFWQSAGQPAQIHLQDLHGKLKAVFGGDLFPAATESIASKCGLYADTILLPDPFLRSRWLLSKWDDERKTYYFMKHAMNLLQYRELAIAELPIPVVAIVPDFTSDIEENQKFFLKLGQSDALVHAKKLLDIQFDKIGDFLAFMEKLDSVEAVLAKVRDPNRLLFDTSWGTDPKRQLEAALSDQHAELLGSKHAGRLVAAQAVGRMSVTNELLFKAQRLGGTPIIDAPTSWQYFNWKLEYDSDRVERVDDLRSLHVLKGLQALAGNEMTWLGKVPHDALIEIRQQGALDEIRDILGKGVDSLASANRQNFFRTADQVFDNIHAAFDEHKAKIRDLSAKKWRFAGKDIGTWLVVGTLEVAAVATGTPVYGLSAIAANQFVDAPKLKDIPKTIRELADDDERLKRSPVGMLFAYANT